MPVPLSMVKPQPQTRITTVDQLSPVRSRVHQVTTDDGVTLAVHEVGRSKAAVTVVFCHGLCLDMNAWRHQRAGLGRV